MQLGAAAEVQSSESRVFWPPRQKEISGNLVNANCSPSSTRVRVDRVWSPSPHSNTSLSLFPDPKTNETVAAQTPTSGYPSVLSSSPRGGSYEQLENGKKSEGTLGCWVFGINLRNSPTFAAPLEKERGPNIPSVPKEIVPVAASETDRNDSSYSLLKKEQKQLTSDASPNDKLSKQTSVPATRTRTKVHGQLGLV